ncbi:MAG TPA: galactokinase family protein [Vicinamibacterales bacterium]|nr:galactokinase family protein [Vicinamibacterales bacterium]
MRHASAMGTEDAAGFINRLQALDSDPFAPARGLFERDTEVVVARAPGRLDVMGGIADYSGALVLQWPIREATCAAVQVHPERVLRIVSLSDTGTSRHCTVPLDAIAPGGSPASYAAARAWFSADAERHWAAYVAGAWLVLARARGLPLVMGARVAVQSAVPEGKGVSSSAALEAAVMQALTSAARLDVPPRDMALLCQQVENLVVGAPCGVMDQMAAIHGEKGRLMALLCQPAEFEGTVPIPGSLAVWGIDSGIRHAVSGADYGSVRLGAFMGYRVLAALAGLRVYPGARDGHVRIDDPRWHGYLANVTPEEFDAHAAEIPERMLGTDFLARYGGTTDRVTIVDPATMYAVRTPARHPIAEQRRVMRWRQQLEAFAGRDPDDLAAELGALMYESHASYSACGLGSGGTDDLVALARAAGAERGIYGAKITGGGSGGTVALLARADAAGTVEEIAAEYAQRSGRTAYVFSGSSDGAAVFGTRRISLGAGASHPKRGSTA